MRYAMILAAALSAAGLAAAAAPVPGHHGAGHDAAAASADKAAYGVGIVRNVDAAQGKVTLQHEPIAALGWPAMTMPFGVKDPKLLAGLAPGRKVRFAFEQRGTGYVITALE